MYANYITCNPETSHIIWICVILDQIYIRTSDVSSYMVLNGKVVFVLRQTPNHKGAWENGGIAPVILYLATEWK